MPEMTIGAVIVEPSSSRTPPTRPSDTRISSTLLRSRSSPPLEVNRSRRCEVSAPMPPRSFLTSSAFSSGTANP